MEPRIYRVRVEDPDGNFIESVLSEEQVKFFKGGTGEPFSTAAWLGYTDLWVRMSNIIGD